MADNLLEVAGEIGDVKNVKVRVAAFIQPLNLNFFIDRQRLVVDYALPDAVSRTTFKVGFTVFLDYQWYVELGPPPLTKKMYSPTAIVVPAVEWDLSTSADGIVIDDMREPANSYLSNYLNLEFLPSAQSSSVAKPARIALQVRVSPTNNSKGSAGIDVSYRGVGVNVGGSTTVTSSKHMSERAVLIFRDMRPKAEARRIDLPRDMLTLDVFYQSENQQDLQGAEREKLNKWLTALEIRKDCRELWKVMKEGRKPLIHLTGHASNTGKTVKVDDDISFNRADKVKALIVQRIGKSQAVENAIIPRGVGTIRVNGTTVANAPKGAPLLKERFVRIAIDEANALQVIADMDSGRVGKLVQGA